MTLLKWMDEFVMTRDPAYKLIRSGRSGGAVIFLMYDTQSTEKNRQYMLKFLLDGFRKEYWAATEDRLREKAEEVWAKWLIVAKLMPVEAS
jgi:hypothetical protein